MSTSCLLSLDFTGEDEILEFAFPYDVAGKTCLSLFDGPEELAFLSHSLKHRDVGSMCCIRDTEHPTIEPHLRGLKTVRGDVQLGPIKLSRADEGI